MNILSDCIKNKNIEWKNFNDIILSSSELSDKISIQASDNSVLTFNAEIVKIKNNDISNYYIKLTDFSKPNNRTNYKLYMGFIVNQKNIDSKYIYKDFYFIKPDLSKNQLYIFTNPQRLDIILKELPKEFQIAVEREILHTADKRNQATLIYNSCIKKSKNA